MLFADVSSEDHDSKSCTPVEEGGRLREEESDEAEDGRTGWFCEKVAPNNIVEAWDELQVKQKEVHVSIFEDKTKPKRRLDEIHKEGKST